MALEWCLAERLMPSYGKASATQIQMVNAFAAQGKSTLKRTMARQAQRKFKWLMPLRHKENQR